jgi:L-malate glycosyltransferase
MVNKRLNILSWAGWYPSGGSPNSTIFIEKHLEIIGRDHNLSVFHISHVRGRIWMSCVTKERSFATERVYTIPSFFPLKHFFYFFIPFLEYFRFKGKIDIFHLHVSYPFSLFTFFLDFCGISKWVLTEHWTGFTSQSGKFDEMNSVKRSRLRSRIRKMNAVSVVSELLKDEMSKRHLLPQKTLVIPNRLFFGKPSIKKLSGFRYCTISNLLDRHKNISGLIRAFCEVSKVYPDAALHIYGKGSDDVMLKQLASELHLLNRSVFFEGEADNARISEVYYGNDCFVLFSNYETFSIVTAEALTHGLPVVATRCGGPEAYINDMNGILVGVGDTPGFVRGMIAIRENYDKFDGAKIIESMQEKYSDEVIRAGFQKLYSN